MVTGAALHRTYAVGFAPPLLHSKVPLAGRVNFKRLLSGNLTEGATVSLWPDSDNFLDALTGAIPPIKLQSAPQSQSIFHFDAELRRRNVDASSSPGA